MTFTAGPELASLFMLVFARVGTMMMMLPGLGEQFVPARLRLGLALFFTLALMPLLRPLFPASLTAGSAIAGTMALEFAIGLMIGLASRIVVATLQTAGNFVAQSLGLSFAETVDPTQGGQAAAVGNFLTLLGVTLIFATDGHHLVIAAIFGSYGVLPPGAMPESGDALRLALTTLAQGFSVAVKITAPFIVFALVLNVGLGVLSRLMPQLQVFFLGLPLTIILGFMVLFAALGAMMSAFLGFLGSFLAPFGAG